MDMNSALSFAKQYDINPRKFSTPDSFVCAIESRFNEDCREKALAGVESRRKTRLYLKSINYGHGKWDAPNRRLACGCCDISMAMSKPVICPKNKTLLKQFGQNW